MKIDNIQKKNLITSFFIFSFTYIFLTYLNLIFPTQSDDIGRKIEGIQKAIQSYKTWNGRFGELLLVSFGSFFSTTPYFAFLNALIGTVVFFLIYIIIFGTIPEYSMKSISCFSILLAFILFDPVLSFGSIFYWAAGSFNYLWSWFFLLLLITPCILLLRKTIFSKSQNLIFIFLGIPIGIIAGWSSEFAIVIIVLWFLSICIRTIKKENTPLWYYTSFISLIIGWLILYKCPGMRERAKLIEDYQSLLDIIRLGPIGIIKKCIFTFNVINNKIYYYNYILISIFLFLSSILFNPNIKKFFQTCFLVLCMTLILYFLPKLFFILSLLLLCSISSFLYKKQNFYISKLFLYFSLILFAEFLFIGSTIQIGIPKRACFQFSILTYAQIGIIMSFCFDYFNEKVNIQKITSIFCLFFSFILIFFVSTECFNMHKKWVQMEKSISEQKQQGNSIIIINKRTFDSKYWSYGDWGNPGEDSSVWPNTSYAKYYEVDSIIAK